MALAVVSSVVAKLGDFAIQEALLLNGLHDKVGQLRRELQAISGFLEDADSRQKHDARVKNWVREIREVSYDTEDIIDTFIIEVERHGPMPRLLSRHSIGKKIEGITTRISEISNRRTTYGISNFGERSKSTSPDHGQRVWRRSSPYLNDDPVVGFAIDSQEISQRLLAPLGERRVVSIVGMGGIGKTTLATKVFKELSILRSGGLSQASHMKSHRSDATIGNIFDICIWISVTQEPDIDDLLAGAIADVMKEKRVNESLDGSEKYAKLVTKMVELLKGERYLIVIDDLWGKDVWDLIKRALPNDLNGSRVLITTRSIEIATYADSNCEPYHLQHLNDEESRELLFRRVFNSLEIPAELEELSRKLSRKCGGLPLALVVLGGLLSVKKKHPAVWLDLVNSMTWESEVGKQCLKILAMSYEALPYQMKSCFLYFSAFPQGTEIVAPKLIELWCAEGLIMREDGRTTEETAEIYLEELIQRCLVQAYKRGSDERVKRICLHDLLLELSISESRECTFFHVKDRLAQNVVSIVEQEVHRLSLHNPTQSSIILEGSMKLRTLLVFHKRRMLLQTGVKKSLFNKLGKGLTWLQVAKSYFRLSNPASVIAYKSSSTLEFMRVLDLEGMHIVNTLPQEIERMIHLRYLNLRGTSLKELPPELAKLQLQTLNVRSTSIKELPGEFWSLKTLRHLYLPDMMCRPTFRGLINLQTLHIEQMDGALPDLINLRKLKIDLISEIDSFFSLRQMVHLISLKLNSLNFSPDVFTSVSGHQTFQKLKLIGMLSMRQLPEGDQFPIYLTKLALTFSALEEDPMPKLERLLSLRILNLRQNAYVGKEMRCSAHGFPRLQCLELNSLSELRVWNMEVWAMAGLKSLTIKYCPRLGVLPEALRAITTLQKVQLEYMNRIPDALQRDNGVDWFKIEHVPSITIIGPR